jgi:hypothetical protein
VTGAGGVYRTSFPRPASGKCGVLAEFDGTQDHMASFKAIPPFDC